jgi:hypothetical protein
MHSIKPVSFCFHLFLTSAAILVAVAFPTNHTHHESCEDLCAAAASLQSKLDMRNLENEAHCHYKVCEDKFGYKNGQTRNPDVINHIVCEGSPVCKQVYLPVEVTYYTDGSLTRKRNLMVPKGCLYSERELKNSTTTQATEPNGVI